MADFSPAAMARIQKVVPYVERSMRNTLPRRARWHGRSTPASPPFRLATVAAAYSAYGTSYAGPQPSLPADDYDLFGIGFTSAEPTSWPDVETHPLFEWQEATAYGDPFAKVKVAGLYRYTVQYELEATLTDYALTTANTSTADLHYHTYSKAPDHLCELNATLSTDWGVTYQRESMEWVGLSGVRGGSYSAYHAWDVDDTVGLELALYWHDFPDEVATTLKIIYLSVTLERIGNAS